jgi:hypothetical protein
MEETEKMWINNHKPPIWEWFIPTIYDEINHMEVSKNRWFIVENPKIKLMIYCYSHFRKHPYLL